MSPITNPRSNRTSNEGVNQSKATDQMKTICGYIQRETAADVVRCEEKLGKKAERLAELTQQVLRAEERLAKVCDEFLLTKWILIVLPGCSGMEVCE